MYLKPQEIDKKITLESKRESNLGLIAKNTEAYPPRASLATLSMGHHDLVED